MLRLKDVRSLEDLVNFKVRTIADKLKEQQKEKMTKQLQVEDRGGMN